MNKKKQPAKKKGTGKKKPVAKLVLPEKVSKQDVGLQNWWDFNSDKQYNIGATNRKYMSDIGYNVYMFARNQGYSVKGAALMLALSTNESGYGNPSTLTKSENQNNFFGIKIPGTQTNRQYDSKEEGEELEVNLFQNNPKKYPGLTNLLMQQDPSLAVLDTAMYSFDPLEHPDYPTYLHDDNLEGVLVRNLQTIKENLADLQKQKDADMNEMEALSMLSTLPFGLNTEQQQKLKADTQNTKQLQDEIDDLKHIQQELQTGEAINKPFIIPDMPNWKMKGDTNHIQPLGPLIGPPFNNPNTNDGQLSWPNSIRYLVNPDDNAGNSFIGNPLNNQASANIKPSATTHSISPANISHPTGAKNRGGGGNISFNMHTNDTIASSVKVLGSVHDEVVAILTSAVADSKIGTDVH